MILRNGKIYKPFVPSVKNTDFPKNCLICSADYRKGDCITSCNISNISRHSFHINCMNTIKTYYCNKLFRCPYCNYLITSPLKKIAFI